jgi:hypothetical protein
MVSCQNDEDCRVWGKLNAVCIEADDISMCMFINSSASSGKCACLKSHTLHNIIGLWMCEDAVKVN